MNIKQSLSIIMDVKETGESDLLVTFFSKEKGKLKGIAKGAKRSKKRFFNCLDLFYLVRIEFESKKDRDLCFLHSCKLINPFTKIREDYKAFTIANYMMELTNILFPVGVSDELMFHIIVNSLEILDKGDNYELARIDFEAKAMSIGGYRINLEKCQNCGRLYTGKGKGVFLPHKGGMVCLRCIKNSHPFILMEPKVINTLKIIQSPFFSIDTLKNQIDYSTIEKIKDILSLHIGYILGSKLKTKKFIDLPPPAF